MIPIAPGLEIHFIPLLLLGLSIGTLSGFTGVGGGFMVTPALIVMGMPVELAVGTSLFWVFLNSMAGAVIHRRYGHTDLKLGLFLALPALLGVEGGVRLARTMSSLGIQDVAILSVSIVLMILIGTYTLVESLKRKAYLDAIGEDRRQLTHQPTSLARKLQGIRLPPMIHFKRSGVRLSLWIILFLGALVGVVTGFIGIGGGFIIVPLMIYVLGIPAVLAVGSSTLQVILTSGYGGARYLMSGSVVFPVAWLILSTSIPGVIYGAAVTKYVRGVTVRLVLGLTILVVCAGSIFKLVWLAAGKSMPGMQMLASWVTFGGIALSMVAVVILGILIRRHRQGKRIPRGFESLSNDT